MQQAIDKMAAVECCDLRISPIINKLTKIKSNVINKTSQSTTRPHESVTKSAASVPYKVKARLLLLADFLSLCGQKPQ